MSLYLKHRPTKLDDIVGNKEVTEPLAKLLKQKEVPHAFLLTGTSGCGKTTIGRIIAKEVGSKGFDIKEIDSADFRGIDTVRKIRNDSQFSPTESKALVWIMDEVHQLTSAAQNALLKILEDTPKHVYFVLCTTEEQKIIKPIKGRCQVFNVNPLDDNEMISLLKDVAKKEGEKIDTKILKIIAKSAFWQPRNALQILEQVIAVPKKNRAKIASKIVSLENLSIDLARLLIKRGTGWKEVREVLKGLKTQEPETIRRTVLGYCTAVLLNKDDERIGLVMEHFIDPFYDSAFNGVVYASYSVIKS